MALASLRDLAQEGLVAHCLVVAPKVALTQWRVTAERMGVGQYMLDCVNPEQISKPSGCEYFTRDRGWNLPEGTLVVWDEPHRNASGIRSQATRALALLKIVRGSRLLAMSATLADSPLKLRGLGYWAGFHRFTASSFYDWCRRHGCAFENVGMRQTLKFTKNTGEAVKHMASIRRAFGPAYVAIPLSDIPGFPDQTLEVSLVDLSRRDSAEIDKTYAELSKLVKKRTGGKTPANFLVELLRLREQAEYLKAPAVAELAAQHIANGKSAVLFSNFIACKDKLVEELHRLGVEDVGCIYGGQKEAERQDAIDRFQKNELHAIVVMTAAGGAALSLHDERHERPRVSLITPSFNAAEVRQALGRIRRCNGTSVEQYFVLVANSIEQRVASRLAKKLTNIDTLNDEDLSADSEP